MWQDFVSGMFSTLSGFMLWNNVRMLYKHKKVKGVSVLTTAFFTTWGFWNLYYYPFLDQWWSFVGGVTIVSANVVWVYLALKYSVDFSIRLRFKFGFSVEKIMKGMFDIYLPYRVVRVSRKETNE